MEYRWGGRVSERDSAGRVTRAASRRHAVESYGSESSGRSIFEVMIGALAHWRAFVLGTNRSLGARRRVNRDTKIMMLTEK